MYRFFFSFITILSLFVQGHGDDSSQAEFELALKRDAATSKNPSVSPLDITVAPKDAVMSTRLQADNLEYDESRDIVTASGNVEVTRLDTTLFADKIIYDRGQDKIFASGNVWIRSQDGNLSRTDAFEVSGDLQEGVSKAITGIMTDNARYVALSLKREEGNIHKFKRVVYSPCKLCRTKDLPDPTWQLRSRNMIYDEAEDIVEHLDATMEIKGVPVFYIPYLYHPGPKTKRKSGLLPPVIGTSDDIGPIFGLPIFWAIDDQQDLTFTPYYNRENSLLGLRYRVAFCRGFITLKGVGTSGDYQVLVDRNRIDKKGFRGFGEIDARIKLTDHWRFGLEAKGATDDTFLKRYQFLGYFNEAFLTSRIFTEGFYGRNYLLAEGIYYQSLRQFDLGSQVPVIAPNLEANLQSKPDAYGGSWIADASVLNLRRDMGADVKRLSALGGYQKTWESAVGIVTDAALTTRIDSYRISGFKLGDPPSSTRSDLRPIFSGSRQRIIPNFGFTSRMPFLKITAPGRIIVEPKAGVVITGTNKNSELIPNEDSSGFELSDSNLYNPSRVPGIDLVDDLSRINYGVKFSFLSTIYGKSTLFLGQSHSIDKVPLEQESSGLERRTSDYLISGDFNYKSWINLQSKLLLKRDDFSARRNESTLGVGPAIFRWTLTYTKYQRLTRPSERPEEVIYGFSSRFTDDLSLRLSSTRQLGREGGTLTNGGALKFEDDCFSVEGSVTRNYFQDRDVRPSTIFLLSFSFKNLGGYTLRKEDSSLDKGKP